MQWKRSDLFRLLEMTRLDEYRGFTILYTDRYAAAKGEMPYMVHNRPAAYLSRELGTRSYLPRLKIRNRDGQWQQPDSPLNLLTLALDRQDPVYLYLDLGPGQGPDGCREDLQDAIGIIMDFTDTDEYRSIAIERDTAGTPLPELPQEYYPMRMDALEEQYGFLKNDYESREQEYMLLKLILENFILANILRIEELIRTNTSIPDINWNEIDISFQMVLFNRRLGIFSLDTAYDNLLQVHEICAEYLQYRGAGHTALTYRDFQLAWGTCNMERWRSAQDLRLLYFYDRESVYYRDLFLVTLIREPARLERFLNQWGSRLDYSLDIRRHLDQVLEAWKGRIMEYADLVDDDDQFAECIETGMTGVKATIATYDNYLQLVRDKRVYRAGSPAGAAP